MGNQSWVGIGNGGNSTMTFPMTNVYSPIGGPSGVNFQSAGNTPTGNQLTCYSGMILKNATMLINQVGGTVSSSNPVGMTAGVSQNGSTTTPNPTAGQIALTFSTNSAFGLATPLTLTDVSHQQAVHNGDTYGAIFAGWTAANSGATIVTSGMAFEQDGQPGQQDATAGVNYVQLTAWGNVLTISSGGKYVVPVGTLTGSTTESSAQHYANWALTLSNFASYFTAPSNGAQLNTRVSTGTGGAGQQSIAPSGAFGPAYAVDNTFQDAITAGALFDYHAFSNGTLHVNFLSVMAATATAGQSGIYSTFNGGIGNSTTNLLYFSFCGQLRTDTAHGEVVLCAPMGGVLSELNLYITSNNSANSVNCRLFKGSAGTSQGQMNAMVAAGSTVLAVDNTFQDTITQFTDQVNVQASESTSGGITAQSMSALFTAAGATVKRIDGMTLMGVG